MTAYIHELWVSSGALGPCLVLFAGGVLLIAGVFFNWRWLYPSRSVASNHDAAIRRGLTFITGVSLIICSVVFYIFKDRLYWG
jgi:hypothetical protein